MDYCSIMVRSLKKEKENHLFQNVNFWVKREQKLRAIKNAFWFIYTKLTHYVLKIWQKKKNLNDDSLFGFLKVKNFLSFFIRFLFQNSFFPKESVKGLTDF